MYQNTAQFEACIEAREKYIPFYEGLHDLYLAAATCCDKLDRGDEAVRYAEEALTLSGSLDTARKIVAKYAPR